MTSVVIVGASHAAADAVSTLRRKGFDGDIHLVGDEPDLPYQRPPLSKGYFKGDIAADKLLIRNTAFYTDNKVTLHLGVSAQRIDKKAQTLSLSDGSSLDYDKLILATGTSPRILSIPGAQADNVLYLRTRADVDRIKSKLANPGRLLIVGAGYIGLEVAASAIKQGAQVSVLEAADRVLARVTGPSVSTFYQTVHQQEGVTIRLNTQLERFEHHASSSRAILADGAGIDFDTAIIGIGVVPNTELAEHAGLTCDNGIKVNEFCQTDDADIYAVGDCSFHPSFIYDRYLRLESVPNATGQAKTAAMHICGEAVPYDQVPWFWSDQYDIKLQTAGLLQDYDQAVVRGEPRQRKFAVFYLKERRLLAVDAINSPAEFMVAKKLIVSGAVMDPERIADTGVSPKELV